VEDADPFKCEGTNGHLMRFSLGALLFIERAGPEGVADGLAGPLDEGLAQELGAAKSAMHPAFVAAALGNGRDTGVFLQVVRVGVALPLFTECGQKPGGVGAASAREFREDVEVFMGLGQFGDARVEGFDGIEGHAQLGDQGFDQQGLRGNDAGILGQGQGGLDLLDALRDDVLLANVMGLKEPF
jgi:hypothetical protein